MYYCICVFILMAVNILLSLCLYDDNVFFMVIHIFGCTLVQFVALLLCIRKPLGSIPSPGSFFD